MAIDLEERPASGYDSDEEINVQLAEQRAKQKEISDLENLYNDEAADTDSLPDNHPDKTTAGSADSLRSKEDEASDDNAGFFNNAEGTSKRRGRLRGFRQRSMVAGVILTLVVGATTFFATVASGPAQFIQFSKLMQKFHFSSSEDDGDSRFHKIMKAVKNRNKPQNNRLSVVGNKLATSWETKLKASGISMEYSRTGNFQRYVLDPDILARSPQIEGLRSSSPEELQKFFSDQAGVKANIEEIGGKRVLTIDGTETGYFKIKKLNKIFFRNEGYSRIGAAARTRVITKRQGISWHPIKALDRKLLNSAEARYNAYKQKRAATLEGEGSKPAVAAPKEDVDSNNDGVNDKVSPDAESTKNGVDEAQRALSEAADNPVDAKKGKFSQIKSHPAVKKVAGASMVAGLVCLAQGLSKEYDSVQYNNIARPLIQLGTESVIMGNQVAGSLLLNQPLDVEQLGFAAERFSQDGESWVAARSIQAELGEQQTGPDMPAEARIDQEKNPVSQFLGSIPAVGTICNSLNTTGGRVASIAINFVTAGGPFSFIFGETVIPQIINAASDSFLAAVSGSPLDVADAAGARFGNFGNFGSFLAANDAALAGGGRALSTQETLALKIEKSTLDHQDFSQKNLASRLFDITDYRSLAGKAINGVPTQSGDSLQNMATFATSFKGIKNSILGLGSIFGSSRAFAATTYDYGVPKIGFSIAERDDPRFEDPFDNAAKAVTILQNGNIDRAEGCFGVQIDEQADFAITPGDVPPSYTYITDPANNCNDTSEDWTRVRFFIQDSQIAEGYSCYEGLDEKSCTNIGMSGASTSTSATGSTGSVSAEEKVDPSRLGYSTENMSCAPGTNDLGVVTSKYTGSFKKESGPLRTRLCQVPDIPGRGNDTTGKNVDGGIVVDAYVSAAWAALGRQAKADGVSLSGSSFRLNDSCGGTGTGDACARPGQSMHQTGWAVDFSGMNLKGPSTTSCSGRARLPNNPGWKWLEQNAEKYGIKQYTHEAWHWDSAPMANRCGTGQ